MYKYISYLLQLNEEEKKWQESLSDLREEEANLVYVENQLKLNEDQLNALEHEYWMEYNHFQLRLNAFQQERDALQQQLLSVSRSLDKLNALNAFNDSFHIWFEGHFATINNFRLGRLPTQMVDWPEINAAWGQAALLLFCLAKRVGYEFKQIRIVPVGSFSKIEVKKQSWSSYELYGPGGLFWQSRYDKAQLAFLSCLQELAEYCLKKNGQVGTTSSVKLGVGANDFHRDIPYTISNGTIGGVSLQWGDDERWTRACKYLLTNLKWLIGLVSD